MGFLRLGPLRRAILNNLVPECVWKKTVNLDGTEIPVRGMPFTFSVKRLLANGSYESNERELLKSALRLSPGDQIVELGGSIGILAAIMSEKIGPTGRVVSVEASDKLAKQSRAWLEPKGNITILTGIGFPVCKAPAKFSNPRFVDFGHPLGGLVEFRPSDKPAVETHAIYDLDAIGAKCGISPSVLVADIEGSETVLLEEGMAIPPSIKQFMIEMHPQLYGNDMARQIGKAIESQGFIEKKVAGPVFLFSRN